MATLSLQARPDSNKIDAQTRVLDESSCDFGKWTPNDWILKDMDVRTPPVGAKQTAEYWRPPGWAVGEPRKLTEAQLGFLRVLFGAALTEKTVAATSSQLGFVADGVSTGTGMSIILPSLP